MGTAGNSNYGEFLWGMAKGQMSVGGLNMVWDFTDGLTKERFIKRFEMTPSEMNPHPMILKENGRIIMPTLGII